MIFIDYITDIYAILNTILTIALFFKFLVSFLTIFQLLRNINQKQTQDLLTIMREKYLIK